MPPVALSVIVPTVILIYVSVAKNEELITPLWMVMMPVSELICLSLEGRTNVVEHLCDVLDVTGQVAAL